MAFIAGFFDVEHPWSPAKRPFFKGRWLLKSSLQDMRNCLFEVRPAVVSICFHDVECSSDVDVHCRKRIAWALKMMLSKFMSSLLARVTIFAFHVSSFGACTLRFLPTQYNGVWALARWDSWRKMRRDLQVLKTLTSTTDVCKTCQNSQFCSVVVGGADLARQY